MSLFAIAILLVSAVLHTFLGSPHQTIRGQIHRHLLDGGIRRDVRLVALFFTGLPPREMWVFAVISVCIEVIYFTALSYAYHDNDFSLIYPVARGAAPAFLALWSFLFLHEKLTTGGMIGLALIIGGLMIIGVNTLTQAHVTRVHFKGVAVALFIALLISIYSAIDGSAVKNGHALPYVMSMFALVPFVTTPLIFRQYEWARIKKLAGETAHPRAAGRRAGGAGVPHGGVRLFHRPAELCRRGAGGERGLRRADRLVVVE